MGEVEEGEEEEKVEVAEVVSVEALKARLDELEEKRKARHKTQWRKQLKMQILEFNWLFEKKDSARTTEPDCKDTNPDGFKMEDNCKHTHTHTHTLNGYSGQDQTDR